MIMLLYIGAAIALTIQTVIMYWLQDAIQPKIMAFSTACLIIVSILSFFLGFHWVAVGVAAITMLLFLGILFGYYFIKK